MDTLAEFHATLERALQYRPLFVPDVQTSDTEREEFTKLLKRLCS